MKQTAVTWRAAMESALYDPTAGFFTADAAGPAAHFRTSVHASPLFAGAVLELVRRVDAALGRPARFTLTDIGAGRGELLSAVLAQASATDPDLARRLTPQACERAPRPPGLDPRIVWHTPTAPAEALPPTEAGLVFANEWLDNVPLDVAEVAPDGSVRLVLVDPATGAERLGGPLSPADAAWLDRWWPLDPQLPGQRAELGAPRDAAWAAAVGSLGRGLAVAVDYAHHADARPPFGTLTGYRRGRETPPVPDGSCDLTAHVALDAAASAADAAVRAAGHAGDRTVHTLWTTQRAALRALGVSGARPPLALASTDPAGYVRALAAASAAAELTDPAGLGGFVWSVHAVGVPLPGGLGPNDGPPPRI